MTDNQKFTVSAEEREKQKEYMLLAGETVLSLFGPSPKAFVHTYGCQANVSDSERLKGMLSEMGFGFTDVLEEADLIIYNTCAIREHAQDRVFGNVGALKNLRLAKKNLRIMLCGCMVQQASVAEKIRKSYSFVDVIFGTNAGHRLPEFVYRTLAKGEKICEIPQGDGFICEDLPVVRDSSFKAWLPIMYGCNNFCSYCIVPYVKGRERSRDPRLIIEEAENLVKSGYKEITLLGQNVNSYGKSPSFGYDFSRLLREINDIEGDFIIRFMTSHPKDCTRELLDTMASCSKVAKHLHLPFQSGCNRVLKEMNRGYTREKYLELLNYAYSVMPELSVTSDVIVGFPGETYDEFCETLDLIRQSRFTSMFSFIYSPRPGTKAAAMPDPVPEEEKGVWFRELLAVQEEIAAKRTSETVGKTYRVLCEGRSKQGLVSGRTGGNVIIEFPGSDDCIGTFRDVTVTESLTWILRGQLCN